MNDNTIAYSVVVPVYNEHENVEELYNRLTTFFTGVTDSYEIVFVDDGSSDNTCELINNLKTGDTRVRLIKFSRNFGHHIAITAGLDNSRGEYVVIMDADLQDRPEDIQLLIDKCKEGYDLVYGIRKTRDDPWLKKLFSKLFIGFMNRMSGSEVPINSCIFRIVHRRVINHLRNFRERERYIIGLMSWVGYKQTGVEVHHESRFAGDPKYSFRRSASLGLNVMTSFSYFPLRLASYTGFFVAAGSILFIFILILRKVFLETPIEGWTSLMVVILFLSGVQLLCVGMIGEYMGRTYREVQGRPLYIINEEDSDL